MFLICWQPLVPRVKKINLIINYNNHSYKFLVFNCNLIIFFKRNWSISTQTWPNELQGLMDKIMRLSGFFKFTNLGFSICLELANCLPFEHSSWAGCTLLSFLPWRQSLSYDESKVSERKVHVTTLMSRKSIPNKTGLQMEILKPHTWKQCTQDS